MLEINRVEFPMLNEIHAVGKFKHQCAILMETVLHSGQETPDIINVGEYIGRRNQFWPSVFIEDLLRNLR